MKEVARAKGLSDLRTATTHHIASRPPRKGTAHLDLYALGMEKQRLETELSRLEHRTKRIHEQLREIAKAMDRLHETAQREQAALVKASLNGQAAPGQHPDGRQWKRMAVDY